MISDIAYEITVIQATFKTRMLYCCCVALCRYTLNMFKTKLEVVIC